VNAVGRAKPLRGLVHAATLRPAFGADHHRNGAVLADSGTIRLWGTP
jgi:hypothetical protein